MNFLSQYEAAKSANPDKVLLFKIGDFWEAFESDAVLLGKLLGLTVTRSFDLPMAGFPHHSLETHLRTLLIAGHRVAICEPVDGSAKREVTRVIVEPEGNES